MSTSTGSNTAAVSTPLAPVASASTAKVPAECPRCDQCGTKTPYLSAYDPYGWLCQRCVIRQDEHDHGPEIGDEDW